MTLRDRLRERVATLPEVRLAVLFGSTARGKERPGSDVDIGVLLAPDTPAARLKVQAELGRTARRDVDVIYLDEAPPLLRFEIAKDGVLLLERRPWLWSDVRKRAMLDWWDWAPTARKIHRAAFQRLRGEPVAW